MTKPSKSTLAIAYAIDRVHELFHDADGESYADVFKGDVRQTVRVGTRAFRRWLGVMFFEEDGTALGGQAATDTVDHLAAMAHAGPVRDVSVRIAEGPAGALYLDLADDSWRAIEVTPDGWRIVSAPPVRFRRPPGLRSLPEPVRSDGDGWEALRTVLHLAEDRDWILLLAWLVGAVHPSGPYPILGLTGEQGTAKTTTGRMLRSLLDPSKAPLRSPPRQDQDLVIAAKNSHIVAFDNLSRIKEWLSDALCRIATGGGYSARQLYGDGDEVIYADRRPIILTSIEDVATRGDLADRTIAVTLPLIPETLRRTERDLEGVMQQIRPAVLGDLLDAVSTGLRNRATVEMETLPRMADFAEWVVACEPALPWAEGEFLRAYEAAREDMVETGIEADLVATAMLGLVRDVGSWEGTATELLAELNRRRGGSWAPKDWPETPQAMGGRVTRAAPLLRAAGVEVEKGKSGRRFIKLAQVGEKPSNSSDASGQSSSCPVSRPSEIPYDTRVSDMSDELDNLLQTRATSPSDDLESELDAQLEAALEAGRP